jgi:hypothetical protein
MSQDGIARHEDSTEDLAIADGTQTNVGDKLKDTLYAPVRSSKAIQS